MNWVYLDDFLGGDNILSNTDFVKLAERPVELLFVNGLVFDSVIFSRNSFDFALYYVNNKNAFVKLPLVENIIGRTRDENDYIMAKYRTRGIVNKDFSDYDEIKGVFNKTFATNIDDFFGSGKNYVFGKDRPFKNKSLDYLRFRETTLKYRFLSERRVNLL